MAYRVTDVEEVSAILRERGLRLLYDEPRRGTSDSRIDFIHPKDAGGVLVELEWPFRRASVTQVYVACQVAERLVRLDVRRVQRVVLGAVGERGHHDVEPSTDLDQAELDALAELGNPMLAAAASGRSRPRRRCGPGQIGERRLGRVARGRCSPSSQHHVDQSLRRPWTRTEAATPRIGRPGEPDTSHRVCTPVTRG